MARKVQVLLVDDLDGSELGTNGETVAFGMGGERYEIDLSPQNAEKFRTVLGEYVSAARNVTRTGGGTSTRTRRNSTGGRAGRTGLDREQSNAVRMWARSNGWPKLADRGRIPTEVVEAFNANSGRQMPLPSAPAAPSLAETKGEVPPKAPAGNSTKAEKAPAKDKVPATA